MYALTYRERRLRREIGPARFAIRHALRFSIELAALIGLWAALAAAVVVAAAALGVL